MRKSINNHSIDKIDKINTKFESYKNAVQELVMREPVNKFIDHLVERIETSLPNLPKRKPCVKRRIPGSALTTNRSSSLLK